jgi:hypothetical protein
MNHATRETFKSLEHHSVARVDVIDDVVELATPESEGWRLVISAALDEQATPTLNAHWEPGLRGSHRRRALKRIVARNMRGRVHRHARRSGARPSSRRHRPSSARNAPSTATCRAGVPRRSRHPAIRARREPKCLFSRGSERERDRSDLSFWTGQGVRSDPGTRPPRPDGPGRRGARLPQAGAWDSLSD